MHSFGVRRAGRVGSLRADACLDAQLFSCPDGQMNQDLTGALCAKACHNISNTTIVRVRTCTIFFHRLN
jgi:hypothetical protein